MRQEGGDNFLPIPWWSKKKKKAFDASIPSPGA